MASNAEPEQMSHPVASGLGLPCLLSPVCSNNKGYMYYVTLHICP